MVLRSIIDGTRQLRDHPLIGSVVPEYSRANLRELLCHSYRVIYRVLGEDNVQIVAIYRAARQLPRRPPK